MGLISHSRTWSKNWEHNTLGLNIEYEGSGSRKVSGWGYAELSPKGEVSFGRLIIFLYLEKGNIQSPYFYASASTKMPFCFAAHF